jgi:tRNA threonylcarbamoyladenosine biosynthesis protein TsaE
MEFIYELEDIASVAEIVVAQNPKKSDSFYEMGAGKTTFIKQLCKTLGVTEATSSPTFL